MNAFTLGVGAADSRLGTRFMLGVSALLASFVVLVALVEKRAAPFGAVDATLAFAVFGWGIPVVAYSAVARASEYGRLDDAVAPLARHGANRRAAVLGVSFGAMLRVAVLGALAAALAVFVAAGHASAGVIRDAATSAWIGALGGAVYVFWFSLGSLFGRLGRGRFVLFVLDAVFGSATTLLAAPWPRAHLRSLLGGDAVLGMPEWQSTAALYFLAAACLVIGAIRVPK